MVLIMYAGTVAIPLILENTIGLSLSDIILLINANLLYLGWRRLFRQSPYSGIFNLLHSPR